MLMNPKQRWELSLAALMGLTAEMGQNRHGVSECRLAWFISVFPEGGWSLQPREQKLTKRGIWSRGRVIALRRLAKDMERLRYLSEHDRRVCAQLKTRYHSYGAQDYEWDEDAIAALVGHPLVFWEDASTTRVEIVKGEPQLLVKRKQNGWLTLSLTPSLPANDAGNRRDIVVTKETPTRLQVVTIQPEHRRMAEIMGGGQSLEVPQEAEEQVLTAINSIASIVTVHSDIGGGIIDAEAVPADSQPHIHLLPVGHGLKVSLLVRPFPRGGPYYRPGTDGETVLAEIRQALTDPARPEARAKTSPCR